ncbi:MAG: hypothetical protein J0I48_16225 [Devosia sp.]|nr:hypothetical protein [Devosia sp.]
MYSLSKYVGEKLAEQFAKWDPRTKIVGLRVSNVQEPQDYENFERYQKDARGRHFNLWTYIDARRRAGHSTLARGQAQGRACVRHHQLELADDARQRRAARQGLPRDQAQAAAQAARVVDLDREGEGSAGLPARYDWKGNKAPAPAKSAATKLKRAPGKEG